MALARGTVTVVMFSSSYSNRNPGKFVISSFPSLSSVLFIRRGAASTVCLRHHDKIALKFKIDLRRTFRRVGVCESRRTPDSSRVSKTGCGG
jgi:hypothetical protein